MAYFDWNATAPMLPAAREVLVDAMDRYWGNPSTPYRLGAQARVAFEDARAKIAAHFAIHPERVIFTSGATEGICGVIQAISSQVDRASGIWISATEHPAVYETAKAFWGSDQVREIPVTSDGIPDLDWLKESLQASRPAAVAMMAANNETGVLMPWQEVQNSCQQAGIPFLCDAVQWAGKMPVDGLSGCAAAFLSGHKFGGPKGTGAVILGEELRGLKIIHGGPQENGSRAGTENVPGILSMVEALSKRLDGPVPSSLFRDQFERGLEAAWPEEISINGKNTERLWNTTSVSMPQFAASRWIARLDKSGHAVSSGSACSTGKSGPSRVLRAMGVGDEAAKRTLRISSGWETERSDWEDLLASILQVREELDSEGTSSGPGTVIQI